MARIRTVKPDFWADEKVGALSPLARLAFIGSWNFADDEGLLRWSPEYLAASVFMYDGLSPKKIAGIMTELADADLLFPYSIGRTRQALAYVVNFKAHQKINRPQPSKLDPPSVTNDRTRLMYAKRDKWICHLCLGPINREQKYATERYADDGHSLVGHVELNLSLDHVVPRIDGGTDYPANIRCAHVSCNKARRDLPISEFVVPASVLRLLGNSVNAHGTFTEPSPPEGKGKGREEEREGEGLTPPSPRCPQHVDNPNPPPCGRCKDARQAREKWDRDVKEAAKSAGLAIRRCQMCDPDGYEYESGTRIPKTPWVRCDHRSLRSVS